MLPPQASLPSTGDLPFTPIEAAFVEKLFAPGMRVSVHGDDATAAAAPEALNAASHWLFSCHGLFNWFDPRQSGHPFRWGGFAIHGA